ncbi:PREDICTED: uncharacterized protein LOC109589351, partial [Amphimedon queenslandica]|uniref:C-terminal of Roc (COR) domain-containing protein n=2 Tax=Amphimedon queenslandica TaxID=400682 RepID=A0AAN0JVT8_AMPQE
MLGPPGSGKTCSQRLLLNEDPPKETVTDSTPIACRAVKASRISVDNGHMKRVDAAALLSKLAYDLKEAASKQEQTPIEKHNTSSKEESSKIATDQSPKSTKSRDVADDAYLNKICKDIVEAIPKAKAKLDRHLVYIVDSGGQKAFQELLPLFTRPASLNIVAIDLSKNPDQKLDLKYRIKEEQFSCDKNFSYTNIEFLKDTLSSGVILYPYNMPQSEQDALQHPEYFVLGTHKDKTTKQRIEEYNKELLSLTMGSNKKGYRIIPAKLGEIIYPVNTMLKSSPERQEESKKLSDTIFSFNDFSDTSSHDKLELPVRWFAFELTLLEKAGNIGILEMDDVLSIGRSLQMNEDDTKKALQYLHNFTIILYYPQVLPNIVFVDPHPILDTLSRLLALTCKIDRRFLPLFTRAEPLDSELDDLRSKGLFAKSLLDKLKVEHGFFKFDFIKLLLHLNIIVETQNGYFLPSALPSYTDPPPESDINPILIIWQNPAVPEEILPVPRGIFSLAVVNLMKTNKQLQFRFPPLNSKDFFRYQDAMSFPIYVHNEHIGTLHFIKKHRHIAIYFVGHDAFKYCPLIRNAVAEAVNRSSVSINIKSSHKLAFSCSSIENSYCIVTNVANQKVECPLCPEPPIVTSHKYWIWFPNATESSDMTYLQKVLNLLNIFPSANAVEKLDGSDYGKKWSYWSVLVALTFIVLLTIVSIIVYKSTITIERQGTSN